jgi:hypothetical protein
VVSLMSVRVAPESDLAELHGAFQRRGGLYSGALRPPAVQPVLIVFIGSPTTIFWTCSHFGHSNVRKSEWAGPGSIRDSIIRP